MKQKWRVIRRTLFLSLKVFLWEVPLWLKQPFSPPAKLGNILIREFFLKKSTSRSSHFFEKFQDIDFKKSLNECYLYLNKIFLKICKSVTFEALTTNTARSVYYVLFGLSKKNTGPNFYPFKSSKYERKPKYNWPLPLLGP